MLLRLINGACKRKVVSGLKMLIKPIQFGLVASQYYQKYSRISNLEAENGAKTHQVRNCVNSGDVGSFTGFQSVGLLLGLGPVVKLETVKRAKCCKTSRNRNPWVIHWLKLLFDKSHRDPYQKIAIYTRQYQGLSTHNLLSATLIIPASI